MLYFLAGFRRGGTSEQIRTTCKQSAYMRVASCESVRAGSHTAISKIIHNHLDSIIVAAFNSHTIALVT